MDTMGREPPAEYSFQTLDLALYTSVLARHRRLVIVGVFASLVLAVLSFVRISPTGIGYRSSERWVNEATLVVTQAGFSEGRSGGGAAVDTTLQRFSTLVNVYAALVESDQVVDLLVRRGLVEKEDVSKGQIPLVATPVVSDNGASTPLMTITGSASSAAKATALTVGATKAFIDTLERRQRAAGIPTSQRTARSARAAVRRADARRAAKQVVADHRVPGGLSATFAAAIIIGPAVEQFRAFCGAQASARAWVGRSRIAMRRAAGAAISAWISRRVQKQG